MFAAAKFFPLLEMILFGQLFQAIIRDMLRMKHQASIFGTKSSSTALIEAQVYSVTQVRVRV